MVVGAVERGAEDDDPVGEVEALAAPGESGGRGDVLEEEGGGTTVEKGNVDNGVPSAACRVKYGGVEEGSGEEVVEVITRGALIVGAGRERSPPLGRVPGVVVVVVISPLLATPTLPSLPWIGIVSLPGLPCSPPVSSPMAQVEERVRGERLFVLLLLL